MFPSNGSILLTKNGASGLPGVCSMRPPSHWQAGSSRTPRSRPSCIRSSMASANASTEEGEMDDIFTRVGNRGRVYALSGFTVTYRVQGWYFKRTDHADDWRGP